MYSEKEKKNDVTNSSVICGCSLPQLVPDGSYEFLSLGSSFYKRWVLGSQLMVA